MSSSSISYRYVPHPGAFVHVPPGEDVVRPSSSVQLEGVSSLPSGWRAAEGRHSGAMRHLQRKHPRRFPVSVRRPTINPTRNNKKRRERTPVSEAEREVTAKCFLSHTLSLWNAHWSGRLGIKQSRSLISSFRRARWAPKWTCHFTTRNLLLVE